MTKLQIRIRIAIELIWLVIVLTLGADLTATTKYGRTALHVAAASGQEEIIEILLDFGAGKWIPNKLVNDKITFKKKE